MSDTGSIPYVASGIPFPGFGNFVRDLSASNCVGSLNRITGRNSLAVGQRNSVLTNNAFAFGENCSIGQQGFFGFCFGQNSSLSAQNGFAGGTSIVSATYGFAFGSNAACSGSGGFAVGTNASVTAVNGLALGVDCLASGASGLAVGRRATASRFAELAHGAPGPANNGEVQHGWIPLSNQTNSATPTMLWCDGSSLATQRPIMAAGARWKCIVEIVAATTGAINKSASWEYTLQIDRPTTAASTIIRNAPALRLSEGSNAGAPPAGWSVSITADTTNGCLQVTVTGDTDTINWTCFVSYIQTIRV